MKTRILLLASVLFSTVAFAQSTTIYGNLKVTGNASAANFLEGYTSTATSGGTTALTVSSNGLQYFTGSSAQTVTLPVTSTLVLGQSYTIVNNSSGTVTAQSSGANTLQAMTASTQLTATCISLSGTGTASWSWDYETAGVLTIGALDGQSAVSTAIQIVANVLYAQSASATQPGVVNTSSQTFAGQKTFSNPPLVPNGTAGSPGLSFTNQNDSGLFRVDAGEIGLSVNGVQAMDFIKSTGGGGFGNVGMGGSASVSDQFPLLMQRSSSTPINVQLSNPSTGAGAGSKFQSVADNGSNVTEMSAFTAATSSPDAYSGGRGVLRCTGAETGCSFVADTASNSDVRFYAGGTASTNKIATINSSGLTLNQSATAVTAPIFTSSSSNPATAGVLELASGDGIDWRNNANAANIALAKDTSDNLTYNGTAVLSSTPRLLAAAFPALTGDVTTSAGSLATSLVATTNSSLTTLSGLTTASSLTTVGTIGTGTWGATTVAVNHGGTGNASLTAYALMAGGTTSTGALQQVSGLGSSGQCLISGGASALPAWNSCTAGSFNAPTVHAFTATGSQTGWLFTVTGWTGTIVAGDTYTNNSHTYTALATTQTNGASGQTLWMSGTGATSGTTLTKSVSASGPATITFSATEAIAIYTTPSGPTPLYLKIRAVGGGGGGGGAGNSTGPSGSGGGTSAWGPLFFLANGGSGGTGVVGTSATAAGGTGGAATVTTSATLLQITAVSGAPGGSTGSISTVASGGGGNSFFGGANPSAAENAQGGIPAANTGSGASGGGAISGTSNAGAGGGAGGFVEVIVTSPIATYYYAVGTGGAGGVGNQTTGGAGAAGQLTVEEHYQ